MTREEVEALLESMTAETAREVYAAIRTVPERTARVALGQAWCARCNLLRFATGPDGCLPNTSTVPARPNKATGGEE